ncbi:MAG: pantoate kinase [Methanophagales archaeon]|nr:pantoate kinase [Methanophagales archaeon]
MGNTKKIKTFSYSYSPSHITGFFEICDNENPLYKGSVGGGIVLEAGCVTEVTLSKKLSQKGTKIEINGVEEEANTSKYVVESLARKYKHKHKRKVGVIVSTVFDVPIGAGLGASGAGALSTALALNELLSLGMTPNEVAQIAHLAEVENNTGLGDVIAEACGGVVIRKKPGPPGIGIIDMVPHRREKISYVVFGKRHTKAVLLDDSMKRGINEAGREAMKEMIRKPNLDNFMLVSRKFSLHSEVISDKCRDAIEAVDAEGKVASAAMIGDTVFVIGDSEALKEFGEVKGSRIADVGAGVIFSRYTEDKSFSS